jgi:hypothetical protein
LPFPRGSEKVSFARFATECFSIKILFARLILLVIRILRRFYGTKIYADLLYGGNIAALAEISGRRAFQIVSRKIPNIIGKTVELHTSRRGQDDAYSEIHHFKSKIKAVF